MSYLLSDVVDSQTLEAPHPFTQLLANQTLAAMKQVQYHDIWYTACLLHPGFMNFRFLCKEFAAKYHKVGEALVGQKISH